jgi:hypothetical protein
MIRRILLGRQMRFSSLQFVASPEAKITCADLKSRRFYSMLLGPITSRIGGAFHCCF